MKGPKEFYKAVSLVFAPQVPSVYAFTALARARALLGFKSVTSSWLSAASRC
jgi:hypothetical protein